MHFIIKKKLKTSRFYLVTKLIESDKEILSNILHELTTLYIFVNEYHKCKNYFNDDSLKKSEINKMVTGKAKTN